MEPRLAIALTLGASLLILKWWRSRPDKRSDDIPLIRGPPPASWLTGNTLERMSELDDAKQLSWAETYGGVVKLHGLKGVYSYDLLVSDPAALQRICNSTVGQWDTPSRLLKGAGALFGPGVAAVDGPDHVRQRRIMYSALTPSETPRMLPAIREACTKVMERLHKEAASAGEGGRVDILPWMQRATLDALVSFAFGTKIESVQHPERAHATHVASVNMLEDCFGPSKPTAFWAREAVNGGAVPRLLAPLALLLFNRPCLFSTIGMYVDVQRFGKWVREKRQDEAAEREREAQADLLSKLDQSQSGDSARLSMTREEVTAQIGMMLFAGHDTVATTTAYGIYTLATHPEIQDRLRAEVKAKLAEVNGPLEREDLESMDYLNAVIKELLRLYPAVGSTQRENRKDDVLPLAVPVRDVNGEWRDSVAIAKGSTVIVDISSLHRRKDIWGEDAGTFRPERWIDGSVEKAAESGLVRNFGTYGPILTFVGGTRTCIGWRVAILELQELLCHFVTNFRVHPVPGATVIREDHRVIMLKVKEELGRGKAQVPLRLEPLIASG